MVTLVDLNRLSYVRFADDDGATLCVDGKPVAYVEDPIITEKTTEDGINLTVETRVYTAKINGR